MYRLEWKPIAENDLLNIITFIAAESPVSAEHFALDIRARVEGLPAHPELYRVGRQRGTREMVVHPNYLVVYRIVKTTIEILRVKHAAQQWPGR